MKYLMYKFTVKKYFITQFLLHLNQEKNKQIFWVYFVGNSLQSYFSLHDFVSQKYSWHTHSSVLST